MTDALRWSHTDAAGDDAALYRRHDGDAIPDDVLGVLYAGQGVWLTADEARGLRDALNQLLVEDGGSAEDVYRQTLEGAQALHAAQHRQLDAAARRIARHVDEQASILARLADEPGLSAQATAGTVLGVMRRTVASLGDLLAAVAGEP